MLIGVYISIMKKMTSPLFFSVVLYLFISSFTVTDGIKLVIHNNCNHQIWPGILASAGQRTPNDGGFHLAAAKSTTIDLPKNWSGRVWARQGCTFNESGNGTCETGDCSGRLRCQGAAGVPPATVVEMTFGSRTSSLHYYDVSLVDGFNLPVSMKAFGGGLGCGIASCGVDLNGLCPSGLRVRRGRRVVGCKSACLAMTSARYCCTGEFSSPGRCRPSVFSSLFKAMCPRAYSYAFDDVDSLNKCSASAYVVNFCPPV